MIVGSFSHYQVGATCSSAIPHHVRAHCFSETNSSRENGRLPGSVLIKWQVPRMIRDYSGPRPLVITVPFNLNPGCQSLFPETLAASEQSEMIDNAGREGR